MDELSLKLNSSFAGKVVRKDLTQKLKQGANVPTYVLEYLLGMYCATDDEDGINEGVQRVKNILADNFVRPDEAEKIKSKIREMSRYTVIDKLTVKLNEKKDIYTAEFSNLGLNNVEISAKYVKDFEKLLGGGIWCIVKLQYFYDETAKNASPFLIDQVTPIQMPNMDMNEFIEGRKQFDKEEWIDVLIRSIGMEPTQLTYEVKWHMLLRMVPLCENNYNMCELGPRGTGKSHLYKEISPNSILVSGGQTTVANLFYNMGRRTMGLVGMWDTVAFDEVAGITFKDKDGIQIMKDYMASGSFARGKEEKAASASMVFVGNINQSVDVLLKTSHLFEPFPEAMAYDSAFFDRMHFYLPGWEIPKMRPEFFTDNYGFITDYLSEFLREMRKTTFGDATDKYFRFGNNLNQRDVIAVRKTVSGLTKLLYPHGEFSKEDIEEILRYALVGRRRVKEQLKKIGGMEFYDVHFSYIDNETMQEEFIAVPEQGSGSLIPEGAMKAGQIYTVGVGDSGMLGVYKLETEVVNGSGKFESTGLGNNRNTKESIKTAFSYFKANCKNISASISTTSKDYLMHVQDVNGVGMTSSLSLAAIIAMCSGALNKAVQSQCAVLGSVSIGGRINKVQDLASTLQMCFDAGAKKMLIAMVSAADIATVPPELFAKFQIMFYSQAEYAVFMALGA